MEEDEDDEEKKIGPHPDASTTLIFTNSQNNGMYVGVVLQNTGVILLLLMCTMMKMLQFDMMCLYFQLFHE